MVFLIIQTTLCILLKLKQKEIILLLILFKNIIVLLMILNIYAWITIKSFYWTVFSYIFKWNNFFPFYFRLFQLYIFILYYLFINIKFICKVYTLWFLWEKGKVNYLFINCRWILIFFLWIFCYTMSFLFFILLYIIFFGFICFILILNSKYIFTTRIFLFIKIYIIFILINNLFFV